MRIFCGGDYIINCSCACAIRHNNTRQRWERLSLHGRNKMKLSFDLDHRLYWWTVIYNLDVSSYRMLWFITSFFRGTLNKITFNKQGCHLPQWYCPQTIPDSAELVLCSHQCIKLALTAGWPLAQHDGQEYQEGRGWQDSILARLHHNCLPVKPVGSTCHGH